MDNLSIREEQIAGLLASGLTKKEVADNLFLSPRTVETHTKNIYRKTGARNLADITIIKISSITGIDVKSLLKMYLAEIILVGLLLLALTAFFMIKIHTITTSTYSVPLDFILTHKFEDIKNWKA